MRLARPWPSKYTVNTRSPYGWRIHPITGRKTFHHGVDVAGSFDIVAPADGIVAHKGSGASGGNVLILKHATDLYTVYYHLREPSPLSPGARVNLGDYVGHSGSTGASTGNHLHFEVRKSKRWGDTVDPEPYLDGHPAVVKPQLLKVDGRMGRDTWRAWQQALKTKGLYRGIVDGKPGPMTYRAIQEWAGVKVDGQLGVLTRKAVQRKLGVAPDGQWGKMTISALQRLLNTGEM